jgi:hypothetical protein
VDFVPLRSTKPLSFVVIGKIMCSEISDKDKFILQGRIYPILNTCINNRYKIILGIFAFYAFILNSNVGTIQKNLEEIKLYGSIMFTLFIAFNSLNYFFNEIDKLNREKIKKDCWLWRNKMELIFAIISIAIVWLANYFL